jgi:hypothetical protein
MQRHFVWLASDPQEGLKQKELLLGMEQIGREVV